MNVAQAFSDRIKLKALVLSFVAYVVLSVILFAVVVQVWIPSGVPAERLRQLAESDQTLLMWQNILGTVLGILAGYLAATISGRSGLRNSLAIGAVLTLYGVFGIYMHPGHPVGMQIGKLISPIPITLIGGWLALRRSSQTPKGGDHA